MSQRILMYVAHGGKKEIITDGYKKPYNWKSVQEARDMANIHIKKPVVYYIAIDGGKKDV